MLDRRLVVGNHKKHLVVFISCLRFQWADIISGSLASPSFEMVIRCLWRRRQSCQVFGLYSQIFGCSRGSRSLGEKIVERIVLHLYEIY